MQDSFSLWERHGSLLVRWALASAGHMALANVLALRTYGHRVNKH
jgi:hypothetical protein